MVDFCLRFKSVYPWFAYPSHYLMEQKQTFLLYNVYQQNLSCSNVKLNLSHSFFLTSGPSFYFFPEWLEAIWFFLVYHSISRYFSALNLSCLVIYLSAWLSRFLSMEKSISAHIFLSVCNKTFFFLFIS